MMQSSRRYIRDNTVEHQVRLYKQGALTEALQFSQELPNKVSLVITVRTSLFDSDAMMTLLQPLFICLFFFMYTLHQDNSTALLTQEHYAFHV